MDLCCDTLDMEQSSTNNSLLGLNWTFKNGFLKFLKHFILFNKKKKDDPSYDRCIFIYLYILYICPFLFFSIVFKANTIKQTPYSHTTREPPGYR